MKVIRGILAVARGKDLDNLVKVATAVMQELMIVVEHLLQEVMLLLQSPPHAVVKTR
jgi:hypothetical protein